MLWRQILNLMYNLVRILSSSVSSLFGWDVNCVRCGFYLLSVSLHVAALLSYCVAVVLFCAVYMSS
jgi:hypothetical protein